MTRALLPLQTFPLPLISELLDLGCGRRVQSTINDPHIGAGSAQQDAQARCATTTRVHEHLTSQSQEIGLNLANSSSAGSLVHGTKGRYPFTSIPTKKTLWFAHWQHMLLQTMKLRWYPSRVLRTSLPTLEDSVSLPSPARMGYELLAARSHS